MKSLKEKRSCQITLSLMINLKMAWHFRILVWTKNDCIILLRLVWTVELGHHLCSVDALLAGKFSPCFEKSHCLLEWPATENAKIKTPNGRVVILMYLQSWQRNCVGAPMVSMVIEWHRHNLERHQILRLSLPIHCNKVSKAQNQWFRKQAPTHEWSIPKRLGR